MTDKRESFGSSATAIMALAGSAIGLGNIWRFPYMVGQNGGAAFIIIYLISTVLLSLPILFSESIIGHNTRLGTFGALDKLAPGSSWKWLGLLTVLSPLIIISFYSVVGGWSIFFLLKASTTGFVTESQVATMFSGLTSSVWKPIVLHTIFLALCALIVSAGIKSGIEKFNKISMPVLFVLIVLVMIYSISLPGASSGIEYLVKPDFSKLSAPAIASAMGQSFFSLSLGVGTVLTYSSYIARDKGIVGTGLGTAFFDIGFAVIAGFAIMPAVFAVGIEPGAGPGLIFETLPYIFARMGAQASLLAGIASILFFLAIVVAALTSAISMLEVGVAYLVEQKHMSRTRATVIIFAGTWALGTVCSVFPKVFDFCDILTSNFLMAFGGLLFVIFVGWKMERSTVYDEFTNGGRSKFCCAIFKSFYFLLRYVAPVGIAVIFVTNFLG